MIEIATQTPNGAAVAPSGLIRACDDCGLLVRMPQVPPGVDSCCPRCDAVLRRHRESSLHTPLALVLASLVLCLVTLTTPFLTVHLLGQMRTSRVDSGTWAFADDGLLLLSILLLATVALVPMLRLSLRLMVLGGLLMRKPPRWLSRPLRWHEHLGAWSMLEVFLFGAMLSYTRLVDLAQVELGPAVYGLAGVVVLMVAADAAFEPQAAWDMLEQKGIMAALGQPVEAAPSVRQAPAVIGCHCCRRAAPAREGTRCMRCGTPLHRRKVDSVARCWALIIAAVVLYVPANLFAVMNIVTLGRGGPHTIMGGVVEFVESGFWPLAVIIFTASVAVPMLKLVGLVTMLVCIQRCSGTILRQRTKLYRLIEVLGRWSMIDVFVVAVLISTVRFGGLASINADVGAACFGAVVILTMLAAEVFDPRLMWDAAATCSPQPPMPLPEKVSAHE